MAASSSWVHQRWTMRPVLSLEGVSGPQAACRGVGVSKLGDLAPVLLAPAVPESGVADPQAGADLVERDAGLFGEFPLRSAVGWLV